MRLRMGVGLHERARALAEGRVTVEGLELDVVMSNDDGGLHQEMLAGRFDACEMSLAKAVATCGVDRRFVAVPVFPNRRFRHSFIYVSSVSGIEAPRDLEGKQVACMQWANTAAVWVRSFLMHDYGVDLSRIEWVLAAAPDEELDARLKEKGIGFSVTPDRGKLVDQLAAAEIAALIVPSVIPPIRSGNPAVRRLFPEYKAVEQQYYRSTGILPISHVVVINRELWQQEPAVAAKVITAWEYAKRLSRDYTKHPGHSNLLWYGSLQEEERAFFQTDPWSYSIEDNRTALEAFMRFAWEQGIVPEVRPAESMFVLEHSQDR